MNVEIKERLTNVIAQGLALDIEPEQIAFAVVCSLRGIDANALIAPTYSSCLSNDDVWTGFFDEILK